MPDPVVSSLRFADLTSRFVFSTTVVASPSGASEAIIGSVQLPSGLTVNSGVIIGGWAAYTLGSTPTSCQLRVRQTNISGTVVADTGAMTAGHTTAASLAADDVNGVDTAPADAQIYKLTLTVAGAGSASTVSKLLLFAIAV